MFHRASAWVVNKEKTRKKIAILLMKKAKRAKAMFSPSRLRFLGAAGTVTGSKYLLTTGDAHVLIDCGLFQGLKELRLKNWDRFPIAPEKIEAVILTHAHIDHSGYIPRLIKEGFVGKIYCTPATLELCKILLPDTGYIQEEDARWLNRKNLSKHHPALPLYTREEAEEALRQFVPVEFDLPFRVTKEFRVTFQYAGHILGAASAFVETNGKKIAFSGDVGRLNDAVMYPPKILASDVDYLVVESTYGDRVHKETSELNELERIIKETFTRKGVVLIPAFAVGRAQTFLYLISELILQKRIPRIPIYLNSPMATSATKLFCQFNKLHKLTEDQCDYFNSLVTYIKTPEESKALNEKKGPMIIISASGMITGGRILHHLKAFGGDPRNTILIAGFQAEGTRGRAIQEGARSIKFHGQMLPINACVEVIDNVSAHADYTEIKEWLAASQMKPQKVFITHGEISASFKMKEHLEAQFHWNCVVPQRDQEFSLDRQS